MRSMPCVVLLGTILILAGCAGLSPSDPPHPPLFDDIEEYRLDNGMLFLLLPRHDIPMVSGRILVRVGNVDNPEGSTGLAHMFEHMAFKGTDAIGVTDAAAERAVLDTIAVCGETLAAELRRADGDSAAIDSLRAELKALESRAGQYVEPTAWPRIYEKYVSEFNAYTSQDVTVYQCDLPANHLEVWMLMESERLQHPVFREFYTELDVVQEERRQRTEDDPEGGAYELLKSLAFEKHPYRYPTIGAMADIRTLTPTQIREFHATYYTPANMIGALVGDFDPAEARRLLDAYFGDIPAGPRPEGPQVVEPEPAAQRRGIHRQGQERRLSIAFPGVARNDARHPAADLLASVLVRGKTSRLRRSLDFDAGIARGVSSWSNGGFDRYRGLFQINVDLMPDRTNEEAENRVWFELARLVTEPVTVDRLDEIRRSYRRVFYFGLQKNDDLAELLIEWQAFSGDWRNAYRSVAAYDAVTPADITDLARELLRPELATVVYLEPDGGES